MVVAKLHIICGNCGSNDDFNYEVEEDIEFEWPVVYVRCDNCGTLHTLSDNAKPLEGSNE